MAAMSHAKHRPRKTLEDYLALPDDVRAELIDGELYVTPSPVRGHQSTVGRLYSLILAHVDARAAGYVGLSPLDVHLPSGDVVQPDLFFVAAAREDICREWVYGAPDLAIEVLSSARPERDRFVKRLLYERNGVREYWLVDPDERSVEVLRLEDTVYAPAGYFSGEQILISHVLESLALPLPRIFL